MDECCKLEEQPLISTHKHTNPKTHTYLGRVDTQEPKQREHVLHRSFKDKHSAWRLQLLLCELHRSLYRGGTAADIRSHCEYRGSEHAWCGFPKSEDKIAYHRVDDAYQFYPHLLREAWNVNGTKQSVHKENLVD